MVRRINNYRVFVLTAKKNKKFKRCNGGFPAEILVLGPYRKVWDWFRSISSNYLRNRTAGELVNTQKCHYTIMCYSPSHSKKAWMCSDQDQAQDQNKKQDESRDQDQKSDQVRDHNHVNQLMWDLP